MKEDRSLEARFAIGWDKQIEKERGAFRKRVIRLVTIFGTLVVFGIVFIL